MTTPKEKMCNCDPSCNCSMETIDTINDCSDEITLVKRDLCLNCKKWIGEPYLNKYVLVD